MVVSLEFVLFIVFVENRVGLEDVNINKAGDLWKIMQLNFDWLAVSRSRL